MRTLVMVLMIVAASGCAKERILPDGTIEHEYLDPAVVALLERVIDAAERAYVSRDTNEAQEDVDEVEALVGLLPPELEGLALEALTAAAERDWAALVQALETLEQARQTRRLPEE